jgi:hypothetical protein
MKKAKGNEALSIFGEGGALEVVESDIKITGISSKFRRACINNEDAIFQASSFLEELMKELFIYIYQNTDYSPQPSCQVDK